MLYCIVICARGKKKQKSIMGSVESIAILYKLAREGLMEKVMFSKGQERGA